MNHKSRGVGQMLRNYQGSSSRGYHTRRGRLNPQNSSITQRVPYQQNDPSTSNADPNLPIGVHYDGYGGAYNPPQQQQHQFHNPNKLQRTNKPNRGRDHPNSGHNRNKFYFKRFENMLQLSSEQILIELMADKDDLVEFLKTPQSPDTIVLMLHVFATASVSSFTANLGQLMLLVTENYNEHLLNYIMRLALQNDLDRKRNRFFWNKTNEFWENLGRLWQVITDILPITARDTLPKLLDGALMIIPMFELKFGVQVPESTKGVFKNLQERIIKIKEDHEKKQAKRGQDYDMEEPPDDFREISIYPKPYELTGDWKPFLRSNKIEGGYRDVHQYLDVQFRLLREDFVSPLRKGIGEYLNPDKKGNRLSDIKIYHNVQCISMEKSDSQMGFLVLVTKNAIRNVEHTKRFMFGALVCFTTDNFNSILFGKIIDRRVELLRKGHVVIGFEDEARLEPGVNYTMLECTVYFEPYYQVLGALQSINMQVFPLQKYLIDVDVEQELPGYVLPEHSLTVRLWEVKYGMEAWWPSHERLHLNPSQLDAYKSALNSKLCIIQGPPGTGKTYLGLKIADTLLSNEHCIRSGAPMLVICYTNHALDQFLEGILKTTRNIVRIGGQSRNKELDEFNIRKMRYKGNINRAVYEMRMQVTRTGELLQKCNSILKSIDSYTCVIKFEEFRGVVPNYDNSVLSEASDEDIMRWLLEEANIVIKQADSFEDAIGAFGRMQVDDWGVNKESTTDVQDFLNENNLNQQVHLDDDLVHAIVGDTSTFQLTSFNSLKQQLMNLGKLMESITDKNTERYAYLWVTYEKIIVNAKYLEIKLRELSTFDNSIPPQNINMDRIMRIPYADRWRLYGHWLHLYKVATLEKLNRLDVDYRQVYRQYSESRNVVDTAVMRTKKVIGMTTTGAAKLQASLQALKCPIVIVEEAAEVLESHIITALSSGCQHLILIGDHKQLRPSTADFRMDKYYNLGISLFERLIKNDMPCSTLNVQHRMRPEISKLIAPIIYPDLVDHSSVEDYPNISGVDKNLFFITHKYRETQAADNSKENAHEAKYLLALARHLILNGIEAEKITILAAYSGQFFSMARERKKFPRLDKTKITILDNYQGEENDVILLSLVRNNEEGKIGFLFLENRVCVALSRAKHGMYIMGNMDQLCEHKNEIWPKIRTVLTEMGSLGTALPLRCKNHPLQMTRIEHIDDFKKVPEGGCLLMCDTMLDCGHKCQSLCHMQDHSELKCYQPCAKTLCEFEHICPLNCYETCKECMVPKTSKLPCGHTMDIPCFMDPDAVICTIKVDTKLPCDHQAMKPCHEDPDKFRCPHPCDSRIEPCGHACCRGCHINSDPDHLQYKCMKNCERTNMNCMTPDDPRHKCMKRCFDECSPCRIEMKKQRTICPHMYNVECSSDVDDIICNKPCKKILPCGHPCKKKCAEECGDCKILVDKIILECGHTIKIKCSEIATRAKCNKMCEMKLACGHPCPLKCRQACESEPCKTLVKQTVLAPCGHRLRAPCHQKIVTVITNELLANCDEKCNHKLSCGHICSGTCGECAQGRMHKTCAEKCQKILVCNHECSVPCREQCQPCKQPCSYKCKHSKCKKKCGEPCTNCVEPCTRRCPHRQCNKKCWEICSVEPCEEPCSVILKCKHPCIGFCGDPCPPFCRQCDKDTVTEIFLGFEDEENARFVYLEDCKHIIESDGMDMYLEKNQNSNQISVISCPRCKQQITSNQRYSDYIKHSFMDVQTVKKKHFGDVIVNRTKQNALLREVETLRLIRITYIGTKFTSLLNNFATNLAPVRLNKRQTVHQQSLVTFESRLEILRQILDILRSKTIENGKVKQKLSSHIDFLLDFMLKQKMCISNQEASDYNLELKRLDRIMQLATIMDKCSYESIKEYKTCEELAFGSAPYSDQMDQLLKIRLGQFNEASKSGVKLTDAERREIVAAIGLSQGHWFKCRNGHPYAIGECGGAMQQSVCADCGAPIGGSQHNLVTGNRVATEMDGALHGAFTNAMNLGNFDPHEFM